MAITLYVVALLLFTSVTVANMLLWNALLTRGPRALQESIIPPWMANNIAAINLISLVFALVWFTLSGWTPK